MTSKCSLEILELDTQASVVEDSSKTAVGTPLMLMKLRIRTCDFHFPIKTLLKMIIKQASTVHHTLQTKD